MSDPQPENWYFSKDGKQYGPVRLDEMQFIAANGQLHPRQDLVWTPGQDEWKPAGEIEGLFEKLPDTPAPELQPTLSETPDVTVSSRDETAFELMHKQQEWVGFGRAAYIVANIVIGVLAALIPGYVLPYLAPYVKGYEQLLLVPYALVVIAFISVGVKRLRNSGMSGWWYLGHFIPILNLWLGYRIFATPPGYRFHHKMDGPGIFLAIIYWLGVLCGIAGVVAGFLVLVGKLGDPKLQQELKERYHQAEQAARQPVPAPAPPLK